MFYVNGEPEGAFPNREITNLSCIATVQCAAKEEVQPCDGSPAGQDHGPAGHQQGTGHRETGPTVRTAC